MLNDQGRPTKEAGYYQAANRNKYSVAIDIASEEGQQLIQEMVKDADVLIENYKAGSLAKYGLDYATQQINPNWSIVQLQVLDKQALVPKNLVMILSFKACQD
jgi:crotonobetainyl-CoA:carnitine CoA-transferase CaiB-like acyl-CoA transferase